MAFETCLGKFYFEDGILDRNYNIKDLTLMNRDMSTQDMKQILK
jgi:hypothetical protein